MTRPASVLVVRNPLRPLERESYVAPAGLTFIDWLTEHYPEGFGRPVVLVRNGQPVDLADADFVLAEDDCVAVLVNPGEPISATALTTLILEAIITAAITAAFTLIINAIFAKPSRPKAQDTPGPDPIYSVSGSQNAARVGDPIPALYGRIITTPDYASQPYAFFADNNQFLDQILVVGWGEFEVHDIRVGETPVAALESDAVEYWQFGPADHGSTIGTIEAETGVMENVVSSPEVADQELVGAASGEDVVEWIGEAQFFAPNQIHFGIDPPDLTGVLFIQVADTSRNNGDYTVDTYAGGTLQVVEGTIRDEEPLGLTTFRFFNSADALAVGPFVTCAPGKTGDRLFLDFVFPQGLYEIDDTTGDLLPWSVDLTAEYQELEDDGTPVGGWVPTTWVITRNTTTPVRLTFAIPVAPGRYRVRVFLGSPPPSSARQVQGVIWTGLKFRLVDVAPPIYGNVTLLVVRIRATNGIAANASTRISADVTRLLPHLGTGPLIPTTSPADAFVDIYTNGDYGARRPLSEVDVDELERLELHWDGAAHFNAGFAQRSTVWEALKMSLQTAAAAPLPLGQLMSVAQDGTKAVRTQLFSDANMIRDTLSIGYNFDRPGDYDGYQVEFRDPATWGAKYATWPPGALDADLVQLFGCTDQAQAEGFARLLWNKRLLQRKTARFETELEGLIPRLGDRVAISADLPRWGRAGIVVAVAGLVLTLDAPPDWSGTGHVVVVRSEAGEPSDPIPVTPGPGPNDLVLSVAPPFALFGTGGQEPTHYAFGNSTSLVRDFTVANVEHLGGARVGIDAIVYNPDAFAGTLPWLEVPV
jgi:hypothetical protein